MSKYFKFYLRSLPFLGLLGIFLSALRTALESTATVYLLIATAVLDCFVVIIGRKYLNRPFIYFICLLLLISIFVGLFNGVELSRRYITDVTNPLFFFCKVYIFKEYWQRNDFQSYVKFYSKIAFLGSVVLLPVAYYIYSSAGVNRVAIFPPLELPFAQYFNGNFIYLIAALLLILLYGKRAQLFGAIATFIAGVLLFKKRQIIRYLFLGVAGVFLLVFLFQEYSDNNAIRRLNYSYEKFQEGSNWEEGLALISAGRDDEINSILQLVKTDADYFFGLGVGFTYDLGVYIDKDVANVHFSPIGFWSKYGIVFTLTIYIFLIRGLTLRPKIKDLGYKIAYLTFLFCFIESFFSYSLFVTPLTAISLGYLYKDNKI
ncbi:hypothetical protein [Nonlabens xiamenensis]|uniref:hypothetical protein n=1 Tax=Nonlabens xiamenensis TaxID=2341043 RepID=UPI000F612039|nr:hypothetical protein [Nonlabens xiamenensis]